MSASKQEPQKNTHKTSSGRISHSLPKNRASVKQAWALGGRGTEGTLVLSICHQPARQRVSTQHVLTVHLPWAVVLRRVSARPDTWFPLPALKQASLSVFG